MARISVGVKTWLVFALALKLHHHFHGPPIDYAGLALAAGASWIGVAGPGEPVLIAAAVFASRHQLDLASVLVVAWLGATAGGIAGWLIGLKAGRRVLVARGPFQRMRQKAVARGEEVFKRHPVIAIVLTPSWIAGINRVAPPIYLTVNATAAALWAVGIGLSAYFVGPTVIDFVDDLGLVTGIAVVVLVLVTVGGGVTRRRLRRRPGEGRA